MRNFKTKPVAVGANKTLAGANAAGLAEARSRAFRARVTKASDLDLSSLGINTIPDEVFQCTNLKLLKLADNALTKLPYRLSRLPKLQILLASDNLIDAIDPQVADLSKLQVLDLSNNELTSLPATITNLKSLHLLNVANNKIESISGSRGSFSCLTELIATHNRLVKLPDWILETSNLKTLDISGNQINALPSTIGRCESLQSLSVAGNNLASIPPEIDRLQSLKSLDLRENPLKALAPELGRIKGLGELFIDKELGNPPADVIAQGTAAILAYLRSLLDENAPVYPYQVKLIFVGQGNVGKTCLVNNLLGVPQTKHQAKTEGVEIRNLYLPHPDIPGQNMTLAAWDFGGQEIQHATHQFFLTNRSLFVLLWNARQDVGKRGGNVQYWLEMIKSRAPESPIFLVATHCDQEPARVSVDYWRLQFPSIKGVFEIGNMEGNGVEDLKEAIRQEAAKLPIMKDAWNRRWLEARKTIKSNPKPFISPESAWATMHDMGVEADEFDVVAGRMHLLGDIIYFPDNPALRHTIVLNPEWLTKRVCEAVSSETVQKRLGVLSTDLLEQIWNTEEHGTREELLKFMEQYDLSYRTSTNSEESIVVQALPDSPPSELWEEWNTLEKSGSLRLRYKFRGTLPPGIPSWFIAREHRFTMNLHWREGALLSDRQGHHKALVQLTDTAGDLNVLLSVRGPEPIRFFSVLQDGLEETLSRYPGLDVERLVPCPGTLCGPECTCEYSLTTLEKYRVKSEPHIKCDFGIVDYNVLELLYGISINDSLFPVSRFSAMISEVQRVSDKVDGVNSTLTQMAGDIHFQQREFTKLFTSLQSHNLTHCPSVFYVVKPDGGWTKQFLANRAQLKLCCEMPGYWHGLSEGGDYTISDPAHWLSKVAPYFRQMVRVLKVVSPVAGGAVEFVSPELAKEFKGNLKLAEELPKLIPDLAIEDELSVDSDRMNKATGVAFQALRELLVSEDPQLVKTGLEKVLMPEGNYLWLCPHHAQEVLAHQ